MDDWWVISPSKSVLAASDSSIETTLWKIATELHTAPSDIYQFPMVSVDLKHSCCSGNEFVTTIAFPRNRFHVIVTGIDLKFFENEVFLQTLKEALPERATLIFNTEEGAAFGTTLIDGFYYQPHLKQIRFGWTEFNVRYDYHSYDGEKNVVEFVTRNFSAPSSFSLREIAHRFMVSYEAYKDTDTYAVAFTYTDDEEIAVSDDDVTLASVLKRNFLLVLANIPIFEEIK
jgi:hypothetical protein